MGIALHAIYSANLIPAYRPVIGSSGTGEPGLGKDDSRDIRPVSAIDTTSVTMFILLHGLRGAHALDYFREPASPWSKMGICPENGWRLSICLGRKECGMLALL